MSIDITLAGTILRRWSNTSLLDLTPSHTLYQQPIQLLKSTYLRAHKSEYFPLQISKRTKNRRIIMPQSKFKVVWDVIGLGMIIYDAIYIPYMCFFNVDLVNDFEITQIFKTAFFLTDIVLAFFTAFYIQGDLILSQEIIVRNYLKQWFWFDLLATLPWFLFFKLGGIQDITIHINMREIYLINLLYLFKLLRLPKINKILFKLEEVTNNETLDITIKIVYFLVGLVLTTHYVACFFYFVPYVSEEQTWIYKLDLDSVKEYYLYSLYWTINTMASVGFGDIHSEATSDKVTAILGMLVCSGIFAYGIGRIENILSKHSEEENFYRNLVLQLNHYMNKMNLPTELRFRVRRYINYLRSNRNEFNQEKLLLDSLSEPIRQDIYIHLRGNQLHKFEIFNEYPAKFIGELSKIMLNQMFAPGDVIFKQGESSKSIYFILRGRLEIYHEETKSTFRDMTKDSYFGEIAFFTRRYRCASARCLEFLHVVSLNRTGMDKLLQMRPYETKLTKDIEEECDLEGLGILKVNCYLCGISGHVATSCQKYLIKPSKDKIIKKMQSNRRKQFKYVNPNFKPQDATFQRKTKKTEVLNRYHLRNVKGTKLIPAFTDSRELDDISASFRIDLEDFSRLNSTPVSDRYQSRTPEGLDDQSIELKY